jgi:hypothetical protein
VYLATRRQDGRRIIIGNADANGLAGGEIGRSNSPDDLEMWDDEEEILGTKWC